MKPRVTFLLPVFNAAATLADTVDSVLSQSLENLELLILDDASTDATPDLLATLHDTRIRKIRNPANLELAATLNRGLSLASADYIARIDADDLCLPHRAVTQADFLDDNPAIAAVGSFAETFTATVFDKGTLLTFPTDPALIAAGLIFRNTLAHPTVMLRAPAFAAANIRYDETIRRAQDYALWSAATAADGGGLQLANIPEVLIRYRVHPGQATARESLASLTTAAAVRRSIIERLGLTPTANQLTLHTNLALDTLTADPAFLDAATSWLITLHRANARKKIFAQEAFTRTLTGRYVTLVKLAQKISHLLTPSPEKSPFAPFIAPGVLP